MLFGLALSVPFTTYVVDISMAAVLLALPLSYGIVRNRGRKFDYFEIIYPMSALYFLYFGFSALYLKQNVDALQYRSLVYWLTPALALALVGYVSWMAGYLVMGNRMKPNRFGNLVPSGIGFYLLVGGIGFFGHIAHAAQERRFLVYSGASGLLSIGQQVSLLFFFAWFLLWYMNWAGYLPKTRRNILFSLFIPAAMIVMYLHLGSKEKTIVTVAIPAVAYWYARRTLPWKTIMALVLIAIFVIFPVYNTFRDQDKRLDTVRRMDRTLNVARGWSDAGFMDNSIRAFAERMGIITSVAAVLKDVPDHVDYRYGDTLILAPIGLLVPRILWPGKPIITIGREFGTTFHLVSYVDRTTKIAPSLVAEFYWNFGLPAVLIGMFLMGIIYRIVYDKFGASQKFDPINKGIYFLMFLPMIHFEAGFAGIFGLAVRSYAVLFILIVLSKKIGLIGESVDAAGSEETS